MSGEPEKSEDLKFCPFPHFATNAIHVGQEPEQWNSRAVVPPIQLTTTFQQKAPNEHYGYVYGRSSNPTRLVLEKCIASLEEAKYAFCYASGVATTGAITQLLKTGDHVISMNDVYGGTNRYYRNAAKDMGIHSSFVDCTSLDEVTKALQPNTKLVWLETPTNPTLQLVDIEAVCKLIKPLRPDIMIVVDNTFVSPYFQRPLLLGADMSVHSLTKYMNGHSDVLMGAVALNDDKLAARLKFMQTCTGCVPSPFDCYMCNRGIKTLAVRMKQHMVNGFAVARFLEGNPRAVKVLHPGLPSHPQYELGKRQMCGYSGMVSFYLKGGLAETETFLSSLKVFILAESLGGFESLAELPALMTHASVPADERDLLGVADNLVRLSVGLEDEEDLIADLDQALKIAVTL